MRRRLCRILGKQFDLVTAHRVCFHRIARRENGEWLEWTEADWKFFINDVRTRFLKPDGRLLLEFNRRADGSSFFTPELRAFFESQGARIVRWKALLAADPARAAAIQDGVAVALWATRAKALSSSALRFAQRNGYNFQSEQSQPSSCSILEMSSANRL